MTKRAITECVPPSYSVSDWAMHLCEQTCLLTAVHPSERSFGDGLKKRNLGYKRRMSIQVLAHLSTSPQIPPYSPPAPPRLPPLHCPLASHLHATTSPSPSPAPPLPALLFHPVPTAPPITSISCPYFFLGFVLVLAAFRGVRFTRCSGLPGHPLQASTLTFGRIIL